MWKDNYNPPNVGSVVAATTSLFTSDADADCFIRIRDVFEQPLGEMTDVDARAEGDYEDLAAFRDGYADVYGPDAWDPEKVVHVVRFEYVGRSRPADGEHVATSGGWQADAYRSTAVTHEGYGQPRGPIGTVPEAAPTAAIGFCPLCGANARRTCSNRGAFDCPVCTFDWYDERVGEQSRSIEDYFSTDGESGTEVRADGATTRPPSEAWVYCGECDLEFQDPYAERADDGRLVAKCGQCGATITRRDDR